MKNRLSGNHVELDVIRELDVVIAGHLRWMNQFNRVLICGTDSDSSMTAVDAHSSCVFGKWYYGRDSGQAETWSVQLKQAGALHKQMHDLARCLLEQPGGRPIVPDDYDRFTATAYRFKTTVRRLQFELIRNVCLVDHLTGAWNRSSLLQRLAEEYERMLRHGDSCCVCMMDLDFFKVINDKHGHSTGDLVLQSVVRVASRRLRRYDSLTRYGGEEFLFCLPRATVQEAVAAMERVRMDIAENPIVINDGQSLLVTASFGVAEMSESLPVEEVLEVADRALLRAKAIGRNQVCC